MKPTIKLAIFYQSRIQKDQKKLMQYDKLRFIKKVAIASRKYQQKDKIVSIFENNIP